jgi:hypothetical protein
MGKKKIGLLEFARNGDARSNIGLAVLSHELRESGFDVNWCGTEGVMSHDVVLAGITSPLGMYEFYRKTSRLSGWSNRKATVIIGGPGVINVRPVVHLADYAVFGRADGQISSIVDAVLNKQDPSCDNVLALPEVRPVKLRQTGLLPGTYQIEQDKGSHQIPLPWGVSSCKLRRWNEQTIGCKRKCKFCQYTWTRIHKTNTASYIQNSASSGLSAEVMLGQDSVVNARRVITALDGCSERLRKAYGKSITKSQAVASIAAIGNSKANVIKLYNVGNLPGETGEDREELFATLREAASNIGRKCVIVLHTTPFKAQALTPMQWEGVNLSPSWRFADRKIVTGDVRISHDLFNEGERAHLLWMLMERFDESIRAALNAACVDKFDPSLTNVLEAREVGSPLPTDFVCGPFANSKLAKIATRFRRRHPHPIGLLG